VDKNVQVLEAGCEEEAIGVGNGVVFTAMGGVDVAFLDVDCHAGEFVDEEELLELDGHVGRRFRGEAEVISEAMAGVGGHWLGGVGVCLRGSLAVAPATDTVSQRRKGSRKTVHKNGESVSL
jgi:hypothetical protein